MKIIIKPILVPCIYTISRIRAPSLGRKLVGFALEYLISSTLAFFTVHIVYISIKNGFDASEILLDIWLFVLSYLMLFPIYEIGYAINDIYSVKFEEQEYKTNRINYDLVISEKILVILLRLLLFGFLVKLFSFSISVPTTISVAILILLVFTIHNFIKVDSRMVTTFPMLRFLRNVFIFLPILQSSLECIMLTLFLFAYTITNSVAYVKRKVKKEFIFNALVQGENINIQQISVRIINYNLSIPSNFAVLVITFFFLYGKEIFLDLVLFVTGILSYYLLLTLVSLVFILRVYQR